MDLQQWMDAHGLKDGTFAAKEGVTISRSQVSRVRRHGTDSFRTAAMLAKVTGLPAEAFAKRKAGA